MIEVEKPQIPICTYWKKFVVYQFNGKYKILALCGSAKDEMPNFQDTDLGPRLKVCPWYREHAGETAYENPMIIEFDGVIGGDYRSARQRILESSIFNGEDGIEELKHLWSNHVQKFHWKRGN